MPTIEFRKSENGFKIHICLFLNQEKSPANFRGIYKKRGKHRSLFLDIIVMYKVCLF